MSSDVVLWELIRASGLVAYVLLSLAVAVGIAVRVRGLDWLLKRAWVFESHQVTSVLALAFTGLHVVLLLGNRHVPFGAWEILVPGASSWRPFASALGTIGLYLLALLVFSSYVRSLIGQKAWRAIHYSAFLGWIVALVHGIGAGSDSTVAWVQYLYLATGVLVGFLTIFRILEGLPAPLPRRPASNPAASLIVVATDGNPVMPTEATQQVT
jgi:sulfoxide reductase heme-binding subunit YedZ